MIGVSLGFSPWATIALATGSLSTCMTLPGAGHAQPGIGLASAVPHHLIGE